jgi:hypothetical protein
VFQHQGGRVILQPPDWWRKRGFRQYPARPKFHIGAKDRFHTRVHDVEAIPNFWLVSDRAKRAIESVAPDDVAFLAIDTVVDDAYEDKTWWLCDVLPIIDAVDEEQSKLRISQSDNGDRVHSLLVPDGSPVLAINEAVAQPHRIFRLKTSTSIIVCDDAVRTAFKNASLTGMSFKMALKL